MIEIKERINREAEGVKCACGGYAELVPCTQQEIEKYGCRSMYDCCCRAFVCVLCKERLVGKAEAPEYNPD